MTDEAKFDAAAALIVTLELNFESACVCESGTFARFCVKTSLVPGYGHIIAVAVGMYGKIIMLLTRVITSDCTGSDLSPPTGGTAEGHDMNGKNGLGDHPAVEVDELDSLPSPSNFNAATAINAEVDYSDYHLSTEETEVIPVKPTSSAGEDGIATARGEDLYSAESVKLMGCYASLHGPVESNDTARTYLDAKGT